MQEADQKHERDKGQLSSCNLKSYGKFEQRFMVQMEVMVAR